MAGRYGITRERQDEWALRSHRLAAAARDAGRFDAELVPVTERPGFGRDESLPPDSFGPPAAGPGVRDRPGLARP